MKQITDIFKTQKGITLVELLVVMGIMSILFGIASMNLMNAKQKTTTTNVLEILLTDLKQQQTKTMIGNTGGKPSNTGAGIYFETNRYTLFYGASYSSNDNTNFIVNLDENMEFTNILLPQSQAVFSPANGEISNFSNGQDSVTLKNKNNNEQKIIKFNKYGVVTEIN